MLKIISRSNKSFVVQDTHGDFSPWEDEDDDAVTTYTIHPAYETFMVPTRGAGELRKLFNSIPFTDKVQARFSHWMSAIRNTFAALDFRLTEALKKSTEGEIISSGPVSVVGVKGVDSVLLRFALRLMTGQLAVEEDDRHHFTFFWMDGARDSGREIYAMGDREGQVPREDFEGVAWAMIRLGLIKSFDRSLIKIIRANGEVLWGCIDATGHLCEVEEPDEMTLPMTVLEVPSDGKERISLLREVWQGAGDDKELAFKARAVMAYALACIPPGQGKVFTWFDRGGTGKTSFIDGFRACFPDKSCTVSWPALNKVGTFEEGVELSRMLGKTVAFSDETPQLAKMDGALSNLKGISTGITKTVRLGQGKTTEGRFMMHQVLMSNDGSVFPAGYAFDRRLIQMPLINEVASRSIPLKRCEDGRTIGNRLFSPSEVGKTFAALVWVGKRIWEKEWNCQWPEVLQKWDGDVESEAEDFTMPSKEDPLWVECSSVVSVLRGESRLFVDGVRKLARVWCSEDGWFYGDRDVDSSATGRIPRTFMLLDEKIPAFNSTLTAGHDPATVSGFIPDSNDGTVKNFAKLLKELGVESKTITRRGEFYPGGPNSLKAPHAEDSDMWKAVRIVLGVQAYTAAAYKAPEVPVENEEDVDTIPSEDATPTITPVDATLSQPVDETPVVIPPVPSPIKMPRPEQQAIHEAFGAEGDLIAVDPEDKLPKGKWSLKAKADGLAKTVKTWPEGEEACAFIPTGHTVLLDLDCHEDGPSGWEVLNQEVGIYETDAFPKTLGELTPSGGIHLIYHVTDASFVERLKSVSHVDGVEVDLKCGGKGQAVCAGSVTAKGRYRVCSLPEDGKIAEMSEPMKSWLARKGYVGEDPVLVERRRKEEEARRAAARAEREARRIQGDEPSKPKFLTEMEAEFDAAIDDVATASSGGRNSSLNEVAFKLFSKSKKFYADFSDEDWLDDESLKERLVVAGIESGLEKSEVIATVESAWAGVFGGTTTVVAPVIEPVIEPEEDVEVQEVVNEDLKKSSSKGASLFQATGYEVDWRGDFHKTETNTSQEELELIHEDDDPYEDGLFRDDGLNGWGESVDETETSQEELELIHEDDEDDGWGNEDYDSSYTIIPLDEDIDEDIF